MFKFFGDCLADVSDTLLEMSGVEDLSSTLARRRPGGDSLAVREAPVGEMVDGELRHTPCYLFGLLKGNHVLSKNLHMFASSFILSESPFY